MNKECKCYLSRMGLNCERLAEVTVMVMSNSDNMVETTNMIQELEEEGTLSKLEAQMVFVQIGFTEGFSHGRDENMKDVLNELVKGN